MENVPLRKVQKLYRTFLNPHNRENRDRISNTGTLVDAFLFVPATFNGLSPFTTGLGAGGRGRQQGLRRMSRRDLSEVFGDWHGAQQRPDRERSISGELRSRGVFGSGVRRRLSRGAGPGGIPSGIFTKRSRCSG